MSAFVPSRHCRIVAPTLKCVPRQAYLALLSASTLALVLGAVAFARLTWPSRAELAEVATADVPNASLLLGRTRAERRMGYLTIVGSVSNSSAGSLNHVEAVVECMDSGRNLIRLDSALIGTPTLQSGAQSSFKVHSRDSEDITHYRITFRHLLGGTIPSRRERR